VLGGVTAALVIAQATLLADAVARAATGDVTVEQLAPVLVALVGVVLARAAVAWAQESAAHHAAAGVRSQLRMRLLARPWTSARGGWPAGAPAS
jgi:ABC-type transport system involved in cytochrome bd biosynthesis fused ATPase/permease subunit